MRPAARHLRYSYVLWAVAAAVSCSIYEPSLLDEAARIGGESGGSAGGTDGKGAAPSAGKGGTDEGGTAGMLGGGTAGSSVGEGGEAGEGASGSSGSGGSEPQGGSSAGGKGGTGGTGVVTNPNLIDGFEDEDLELERTDGRGGVWYLFDDGSTGKAGPSPLVCTPLSDAPEELGGFAMHITATGFTVWGSGLGVDFRAGKKLYDASSAEGIRFWARVGDGKNTRHRFQLVDVSTDKLGKKCNAAADAPELEKCDDHFGKDMVFTTEWAQYTLPFAELEQLGFGLPATLDPSSLYGLQITAKPKLEVDLWLDNFEFY